MRLLCVPLLYVFLSICFYLCLLLSQYICDGVVMQANRCVSVRVFACVFFKVGPSLMAVLVVEYVFVVSSFFICCLSVCLSVSACLYLSICDLEVYSLFILQMHCSVAWHFRPIGRSSTEGNGGDTLESRSMVSRFVQFCSRR